MLGEQQMPGLPAGLGFNCEEQKDQPGWSGAARKVRCSWRGRSQVLEDHIPQGDDTDLILRNHWKLQAGEGHNLIFIHKMGPCCEENGQVEGLWEKSGQRSW